jgi:hypothetical protein
MKKTFVKAKNHKDKTAFDDRMRINAKAVRQHKEAKVIERAIKRRDYQMLAEDI